MFPVLIKILLIPSGFELLVSLSLSVHFIYRISPSHHGTVIYRAGGLNFFTDIKNHDFKSLP